MLSTVQNTALILFTRTPQEEVAHKRILGNQKVKLQKQFFKILVQHARNLGEQSGLPFYVVDSNNQQGGTFGERLQQVFTAFFAQGFAKVIAIGNDCVQLSATDILEAAKQLQNNKAVFGPARDGGVYLLGLDQTLPTHQLGFTQINWQTSSVLSELQDWCGEADTFVLPVVYADLDNIRDVRWAFATEQLPSIILKLLSAVFSTLTYLIGRFTFLIINQFTPAYRFRGPPVY